MTDREFIAAVQHGEVQPFEHREHVRLAFALVTEFGVDEAAKRAQQILHHLAAAHGEAERFHVSITVAWIRAVGHHASLEPAAGDFSTFVERFPQLLRRDLLDAHYSPELLFSSRARAAFVEPDRMPIPA